MPNLKNIVLARHALKSAIREFFLQRAYLEIDTPILVKCPGTELHLGYFKTDWVDHRGLPHRLWLRSSPELAMKRTLCEGLEAVFQLAPSFRNYGDLGLWHQPEFTMLEWYQVGSSFDEYLSLTEDLFRFCLAKMQERFTCPLILPSQLARWTVRDAFEEFAGVHLTDHDPDLARQAREKGVLSVGKQDDFETAFFKILLEKVEPAFEQLGFVLLYDYPPSQAALARVDNGVAKRFEFYIKGIELSNGFWELCDPEENERRVRDVHRQRALLGKDVPEEDREFYAALAKGLPDCFGNALGFDRLLALILGKGSIADVMIYPF
ncbi:MAG: EF-P lysine aminoacylase GenX [Deltaproteobacteria bacterium]|nr:EF-P lysine aminoacylase GenX [Deltaproteobacteria bacterium]